jgi:formylglycine-generating enzyme required for sulfatase activity
MPKRPPRMLFPRVHAPRKLLQRLLPLAGGILLSGAAFGDPPHPHEPEFPDIDFPPEYEPRPREPRETREPRAVDERVERRNLTSEGGMLRLPGGEFLMGYDGPLFGEPNERPMHPVRLAPFWLDRTEVTVGDMRACVVRGDCTPRLGAGPSCTADRSDPLLPINCVPWQAADAYCRAAGKRLPTEAEWEFAAGAGQKARFPWGSIPPTCAVAVTLTGNHAGASCSPGGPAEVGAHPRGASPFGLEDMAGNVEEWVADWYADRYEVELSPSAASSPGGPAFGVAHVLRGGGWMSRPREARVTVRSWGSLNEAGPNVGFRCARD